MCPEERRRRNIQTCCVSLEMAVANMMYFFFLLRGICVSMFLQRGSCVSFSFVLDSKGTVRSSLITVLRTVRLNRGSNGSLLFGHRSVLEHKRTVIVRGSRFSRSDRTVWFGFQNLVLNKFQQMQVNHILWEANSCVDAMAKR